MILQSLFYTQGFFCVESLRKKYSEYTNENIERDHLRIGSKRQHSERNQTNI